MNSNLNRRDFVGLLTGAPAIWPQWRGPERTGQLKEQARQAPWPEKLTGLKPLWRVDLDKGYPGPIVAEDRVFVAETANTDTEIVRALDRKTGRELWRASWKGKVSVPFYAKRSGDWIRSTPAWDGSTLYAGGMEEVLVALDGKTGKELWRVDFPQRFGTKRPDFGFASSPLIDGDAVYVQAADSVVKLNRRTGETIWRGVSHSSDIMEVGAFSSPFLATLAGKRQLLVLSRTSLHGVDPETGKELWKQDVPNYRGMNILTPVVWNDCVLMSSYRMDTWLYRVTSDKSGTFACSEVWKNKAKGYMSTPVIVGDHAYLHLMSQRFTCLDLKTGESPWTTEPFGQYWSMVARGDRMLALDESGKLLLIRATPEKFDLLDSRELTKSPAWAHLAVAGNELYVRELTAVSAWQWT